MPSTMLTTVLFLTLSFCSAKCTHFHAVSTAESASTLSRTVSPALPTVVSTTSPTKPSILSTAVSSGPASTISQESSSANVLERFKPGAKWQIAIQDPVDPRGGLQPADANVVDVDLFLASKDTSLIPTLHAAGAVVLCYFNAGAIQFTDCDWPDWNDDGLFSGKSVVNYDQERYVDVTDETVIGLHHARIDLAHSIGCDGVDPDNIDTYELDPDESIGKQITQDDMVSFLENLASYAHSKTTTLGHPLMIGQKNAVELTERIHLFMDFAISENCIGSQNVGSNRGSTDAFCSNFQEYYANNDKPVFDIEYPASLASGGSTKRRRDASDVALSQAGCSATTSASDLQYFCPTDGDNSAGISRILKLDNDEFGLNGCTQYCSEATSFVLPTYESNSTNSCCFGTSC